MAAVFAPLVRGYLLAAGIYYCVITPLHLTSKVGAERWIMFGLAAAATLICLGLAWRLRRPMSYLQLELAALSGNVFVLANVLGDQLLGFEEHQLIYHLLMGLAFAAGSPSRRVAYLSVAVAILPMLPLAEQAQPGMRDNAGFIAFAAGLVSIGMSTLLRGTVLRELRARLAAEELSGRLQAELSRNEQLRRRSEALAESEQAANRAKSAFLATVSHELRTPLNGVLGMAKIMQAGRLSAAQRHRLDTIHSSGRALLRTINDVLDVSQIESGRLELAPAAFDLAAMADELAALYGPLAAEKGLAFALEVAPEARGWRHADGARLRQVFSNLLSNALKFTEAGSVVAQLSASPDHVHFSVRDTGIGIAPDAAPHLFEKFVQADSTIARRFGGSGLGLAICREIVERMQGEISFESDPGMGAAFHVTVKAPATIPAPTPLPASQDTPDAARALRVLVADDNAVNRTVVETLLEPFGFVIRTAECGAEAVQAWEDEGCDVILMDIHMPGMDGVAATAEIRRREGLTGRTRTPIVALTASAMPHEIDAYLAAGMDDCVTKPIDLTRLVSVLERHVEPQPEDGRAASAARRQS